MVRVEPEFPSVPDGDPTVALEANHPLDEFIDTPDKWELPHDDGEPAIKGELKPRLMR